MVLLIVGITDPRPMFERDTGGRSKDEGMRGYQGAPGMWRWRRKGAVSEAKSTE
jgi:hypothetical protein